MRGHRLLWLSPVTLLAAVALIVSLTGCGSVTTDATSPTPEAIARQDGGSSPVSARSPRPAAPDVTAAGVATEAANLRESPATSATSQAPERPSIVTATSPTSTMPSPTLSPRTRPPVPVATPTAPPTAAVASPSPTPTRPPPSPAATPTAPPTAAVASPLTTQTMQSPSPVVTATPTPNPTPTPRVVEIVHVEMSTPCAPGLFTSSWHYRDYLQWTPDGTAILFTQGASLYAVAADGSRLWRLLKPRVVDGSQVGLMAPFSIAPGGGRIVYATCEYGDPQATAARREDVQRQALAGRMIQGTWWAGYDHKYELASIQIDGADHVRLTQNQRFDNFPAWSPDGTRIAFLSSDDWLGENNYLYTVPADGTEPRQIGTGPGDLSPHSPQWAPAGDELAVVAKGGGTGNVIYVVQADGTGRQRLTETVSLPSWSPDGTRLAFARPDGEDVALYTIARDGTDARRLATIEGWQPKNRDPNRPGLGSSPSHGHRMDPESSIGVAGSYAW